MNILSAIRPALATGPSDRSVTSDRASVARTACCAAALLALAWPAHAGLPLWTEDAGVLDAGACEFEAAAISAREEGISALEHGLGLACGVGSGAQLGASFSRASALGFSAQGLGLGGKINVWKGADGAAGVLTAASGWAKGGGTGWEHVSLDLGLAFSLPLNDRWTTHLNLGHSRDTVAEQSATTWAAALEHSGYVFAAHTLQPVVELFGDDHGSTWWSTGLRLTVLPERLWMGVSYGRAFDSGSARLATLSLKLAF